jgi:hypothetical protein
MSADRSPEGVSDLAGGVAEWVWRGKRPPAARGGSWASAFAAELRTWHAVERDASEQRDDLGVRCRYAGDGM